MKYASIYMLATFTNPTFYDVITDLVTLPKLPHILYSYLIFIGQPDDGLHTGPKHVVSYYISLLTVILFSSWLYACMYGYIQTAALYYKYRLHQIKCRHLCTLNINYHWILALNIVITTEISAVSVAIFTVRHTVGAAFTVACFKLLHSVGSRWVVDRHVCNVGTCWSIVLFGNLACCGMSLSFHTYIYHHFHLVYWW